MSDPVTASLEPRTESGKALLEAGVVYRDWRPVDAQAILAIEEQARSSQRESPRRVGTLTRLGQAHVIAFATAAGITTETANRIVRAIEEQAATEARRELLAKVEGLPDFNTFGAGIVRGAVNRAAVLRLIEESDRG